MGKKKALIITDGSKAIQTIAHSIKDALSAVTTKIITAEKFAGNDILPVDIFILGCEKPASSSFAYLEDLLSHISLASRKCFIYSSSAEAVKYLKKIVKDCEAKTAKPKLLFEDRLKKSDIKSWLKGK